MSKPRPITFSVFGLIAGAVTLVLVTAIIVSALAAIRIDSRISSVVHRLETVTNRVEQLQANDAQSKASTAKASARINDQNRELQHRIGVLTTLLRRNGLTVPPEPHPTSTPGPDDPKAPGGQSHRRPHQPRPQPPSPGSPAPTEPSPRSPSPSPVPPPNDRCVLLPVLCVPLSLPTLLLLLQEN